MAEPAAAEPRTEADGPASASPEDFEFCILSSGGLVPAGKAAAETDMCVADELFCHGKLLPLRPSSASAAGDIAAGVATLPRSESAAASTVGLVSRSGSRSASSSGSSSGCVSRSQSTKSASSDHGGAGPPPRRSLSSSLFYAHPSPSPQLRSSARPRRSTGSAPPPAAWGLFRLGVAGAPDVYPPPRHAEAKIAAAARGGGGSRSARFEQVAAAVDRKLGLAAMFGDGLGCKCSPDAVEPVRLAEAAAKRSRKKGGAKSGHGVVRRSRILDWLEELSIIKDKK